MKKILFSLVFVLSTTLAYSQNVQTTTFWVAGICGLCEETIEKACDAPGIIDANYDLETGKLTVTYRVKKITLQEISALINEQGYDTEFSKATDEQYARTHHCCKYRDQEKH